MTFRTEGVVLISVLRGLVCFTKLSYMILWNITSLRTPVDDDMCFVSYEKMLWRIDEHWLSSFSLSFALWYSCTGFGLCHDDWRRCRATRSTGCYQNSWDLWLGQEVKERLTAFYRWGWRFFMRVCCSNPTPFLLITNDAFNVLKDNSKIIN